MIVANLQLPFPPSANRIWRKGGDHIHKSTEYKNWLMDAGLIAKSQRQPGIVGPYKLSIQASRPDRRRRDLDNLIKPISDLLTTIGIIDDDCHCELLTARWVTVGHGIAVRIEPATQEGAT